jgi:hypothetical protein
MKPATKVVTLVLLISLLAGCSKDNAAEKKAAFEKQKLIACGYGIFKDGAVPAGFIEDLNKLAKMDPALTDLAQQAYELNYISQLAKAGTKSNENLSRALAIFSKLRQFCDS